jgi:tetratricopeptide (TPR) repeat protein
VTEVPLEHLRESARHELHVTDPIQRLVAVLIIVVTLLAAVGAYLETEAGGRAATANRAAQEASVGTMAALVDAYRNLGARDATSSITSDLEGLRYSLGLPAGDPYAAALSQVYGETSRSVAPGLDRLFGRKYLDRKSRFEYDRFFADQLRPGYLAAEHQQAAAIERDGWASKRGRYVAVITIFAVALFLLGLTLTLPPPVRKPFVWIGSLVAAAAAIWGVVIFSGGVSTRPERALEAYVDARAEVDLAELDPKRGKAPFYKRALADLNAAIDASPDYGAAYLARGDVYTYLDLLKPTGPKGSEAARADWQRALELDPRNYVAANRLGGAEFFLGHDEAAFEANRRALEISAVDPEPAVDNAVYLAVLRREPEYLVAREEMKRALVRAPSEIRDGLFANYTGLFQIALRARPDVARELHRFSDDLLSIQHEIEVSTRLYKRPTPPHTDAKVGALKLTLAPDRRRLEVRFTYDRATLSSRLLYRTYVNETQNFAYTRGPGPLPKLGLKLPSGAAVLTFSDATGWRRGAEVRVEVFVDANLLSTATYRIP